MEVYFHPKSCSSNSIKSPTEIQTQIKWNHGLKCQRVWSKFRKSLMAYIWIIYIWINKGGGILNYPLCYISSKVSTCLKHMWLLYFCVLKDLFSSWDCETGLMQSATKKDAELVVETYFRLKEKERPLKGHSGEHGGGKQKTLFACRKTWFYFL